MNKVSIFVVLFVYLLLSIPNTAQAELEHTMHFVEFTDKSNSQYTLDQPEDFLSIRALERRKRYEIPLSENDLPVTASYIQEVLALGAKISYTTKWMNGIIVELEEAKSLRKIKNLPFVKKVQPIAARNSKRNQSYSHFYLNKKEPKDDGWNGYYGRAMHQIHMVNGHYLHSKGYTGKGMLVAIMDAGFINVDRLDVFRKLHDNGQIVGTWDFVDGDNHVYAHGTHGTNVFSIMGGNLPGVFVGAAPDAHYYLFRTEDGKSETPLEEFNWIAAAEFADSAGVDIINTSLGYALYDDEDMSYSHESLDGKTAFISQAANIAAQKGILVIASAGNKGNMPWKYVTPPADAPNILSIGAVDGQRNYSSFSSLGPTFDERVKPNVSGLGTGTAYFSIYNEITRGNGTSYSAPLIAGLATCLWQGHRDKTNFEIMEVIEQAATQYEEPDEYMGYGIADFYKATKLIEDNIPINQNIDQENVAFNFDHSLADQMIYYVSSTSERIKMELMDLSGQVLEEQEGFVVQNKNYAFTFKKWQDLPAGTYLAAVYNQSSPKYFKLVKD